MKRNPHRARHRRICGGSARSYPPAAAQGRNYCTMIINDLSNTKENTISLDIRRVSSQGASFFEKREVIKEHHMDILINEVKAMTVVCTPSDLLNLAAGRMISEGYVDDPEEIESISICESGARCRVFLKETPALCADAPEIPTCCTDNINHLSADSPLPFLGYHDSICDSHIFKLAECLKKDTSLHRATSGTHSAYLMYKGELVYSCSDIGRHNALDKAIGEMYLKAHAPEECIIYTTGRVPTDMVKKAIRAKLPVLVSKSVPTADAAELSEKHGLRLICRAWPDSFDLY